MTIEPTGAASVGVLGPNALRLDVSTDLQAAPVTGVLSSWEGVGFYRRHRGWWREALAPATGQVQETRPARFTRDGRAFVAYYSFDHGPILAARAADGAWTRTIVPRRSVEFALTIQMG